MQTISWDTLTTSEHKLEIVDCAFLHDRREGWHHWALMWLMVRASGQLYWVHTTPFDDVHAVSDKEKTLALLMDNVSDWQNAKLVRGFEKIRVQERVYEGRGAATT